ncbi:hypothetical protein M405DRAFT_931782 [Rhizopogon salebrosus TDB-379]|nr:hypothetical protein M405DRAFT_931782 [Rhizopogon salebrosus TDB-379]
MASKGHLCSRTCIGYSAHIPFVVRLNERNVLHQRQLEYELVEKHGIHVIRQTLADRPCPRSNISCGPIISRRPYPRKLHCSRAQTLI